MLPVELESRVESRSVNYARELGYLVLKMTPMGSAGWPDRTFITKKGTHVYIEFKRKGERLRKLQEHRRYQLQQHSCLVYGPVDDFETAKSILDEYVHL